MENDRTAKGSERLHLISESPDGDLCQEYAFQHLARLWDENGLLQNMVSPESIYSTRFQIMCTFNIPRKSWEERDGAEILGTMYFYLVVFFR